MKKSYESSKVFTKCSAKWAQCGGVGFNGPTCCESGTTCRKMNKYYSYCF
ncbi:hypothetical protein BCR32DRAFT_213759 [Anaeromyces robustus]|uniref:CBM1 domain-containing protein n=1 Tax=Anaeromyces robustus TaxID=1754192 RepID=A0A1Y1VQN0_9FUNG|nr:hypothetical protein BCR32DRAFT_213759 [Anaeromyces robustus]|eukprot:ORX63336.1 hypothetical protein BCR32DRAFT_213759 [Anaeromyces robustus]